MLSVNIMHSDVVFMVAQILFTYLQVLWDLTQC